MNYKLELLPQADDDIDNFSNREKVLIYKQFKKIIKSPELGQLLGNKNGYDLSGCRKMYADSKKIRIVYRIIDDKIVVEVISVGKREDMKVYKKAAQRI
jgi:mRNA interferase RelE/StbE